MSRALLCILLLAAVFSDILERRIPNKLVAVGIAMAIAMHIASMLSNPSPINGMTWAMPLIGLAAGFCLMAPLYLLRATGAGDVKLMAMVGAFIGAPAVITSTLYTLLAGGLLSLVFMLGRGVAAETLSNLRFMVFDWAQRTHSGQGVRLPPLQSTAARLPYAVAIAAGTGLALLWPLQSLESLINGRGP